MHTVTLSPDHDSYRIRRYSKDPGVALRRASTFNGRVSEWVLAPTSLITPLSPPEIDAFIRSAPLARHSGVLMHADIRQWFADIDDQRNQKPTAVRMSAANRALLTELGDGNMSAGFRRLCEAYRKSASTTVSDLI